MRAMIKRYFSMLAKLFKGATDARGSTLMEVLVVGMLLSVIAGGLLTALLGAGRSTRRAGSYVSAAALAEAVAEEVRLMPANDSRLEAGSWEWCPPDCPDGIEKVQVSVDSPFGLPDTIQRVTVTVQRENVANPVQVVSYVRR